MAPPRPLRDLLEAPTFVARLNLSLNLLNKRFSTSILFDEDACHKAHGPARNELEILLDTNDGRELYEAFDTFIDILTEALVVEQVFSPLLHPGTTSQITATIRSLLERYSAILSPDNDNGRLV
jgi:hypothetical protein